MGKGIETTLERIRKKYLLRMDDAIDGRGHWVTINGTHVHINGEGDVDFGPEGIKKALNKSKYSTKEEYQREIAKMKKRRDAMLERVEKDKKKRREEIIKKYGGSPIERRIEIKLGGYTPEEEHELLVEVYEDELKISEEIKKLSKEANKRWYEINDKYRASFDPDYEFKKLESPLDSGIDHKAGRDIINPEHLTKNCQRCAMAYELRARGYDVKVSPGESDYLGNPGNILNCFVNPERADFTDFKNGGDKGVAKGCYDQMKEWGDGARAYVIAIYANHGHAYNLWNRNGKIYVADSQIGAEWTVEGADTLVGGMNMDGVENVCLIRTDNAKLGFGTEEYVEDVA